MMRVSALLKGIGMGEEEPAGRAAAAGPPSARIDTTVAAHGRVLVFRLWNLVARPPVASNIRTGSGRRAVAMATRSRDLSPAG